MTFCSARLGKSAAVCRAPETASKLFASCAFAPPGSPFDRDSVVILPGP